MDGPSKAAEPQLEAKQAISSVATTSAPSPRGGGGTGLTLYSNAEVSYSTQ
jgi:hypothetical protein